MQTANEATALASSSMSLGTAGAVLVGGVDRIVDVGTTSSTRIVQANRIAGFFGSLY